MAKKIRVLDSYDFSLYDYESTKKNVKSRFEKYRRLKEREEDLLNAYKKSGLNFDVIKSKNIDSNDMLNKLVKLEPVQKLLKKVDDIVTPNRENLDKEEELVLDKYLIGGCNNEDLMGIMNRNTNYVNKIKKSCIIKVAIWFGEEVYDLNSL